MLDYDKTRQWDSGNIRQTLTARDVMLYALGVGLGKDPLDHQELRYVTEDALLVLPSMATVLAYPGFWIRDNPALGIDHLQVLHGEQSIQLHRPLPAQGTVIGRSRVTRVVDKGPGKGALVYHEKRLTDEASGELLAVCEATTFCRADGGFSARGGGDPPAPAPAATPERPPDQVLELPTRPEAALIYRLSGDYNPLHANPAIAKAAGYPRPILHGLGTYGIACHGLLKAFCDYDPGRLRSLRARFSGPAWPGDRIRLEFWRNGDEVAFVARVPERNVTVLSHGHAVCAAG